MAQSKKARLPITESALADLLFPYSEDEENSESILDVPPEQRRLRTETYDFSVSTLISDIESGRIYIPEFQRGYIWTDPQASRLIESLVIQCPIPVIYLSQSSDERLGVIDGNQRLRSIRRYVKGEFPLKGLTTYPELNGHSFEELDPRFQRHILHRTLRCIVITRDTHPQVKFDVFERINSGASRLSAQELRHGIYYGPFVRLIDELAKESSWTSLLPSGLTTRMKPEELIIRFFALRFWGDKYSKPLVGFLNKFTEDYKEIDETDCNKLRSLFLRTVDNVHRIYGDLAFKIFDEDLKTVSSFNAALFDAEMQSAAAIDLADGPGKAKRAEFLGELYELFLDDEFRKAIGRATSGPKEVRLRIKKLTSLTGRLLSK